MKTPIPKIIHQIWSGVDEPLPEYFSVLGETWKKYHPDWNDQDTYLDKASCYPVSHPISSIRSFLVPQTYDAENVLLAGEPLLWHKVFAPMPGGNVSRRKQPAVLLLDRMQERTIPILFYI